MHRVTKTASRILTICCAQDVPSNGDIRVYRKQNLQHFTRQRLSLTWTGVCLAQRLRLGSQTTGLWRYGFLWTHHNGTKRLSSGSSETPSAFAFAFTPVGQWLASHTKVQSSFGSCNSKHFVTSECNLIGLCVQDLWPNSSTCWSSTNASVRSRLLTCAQCGSGAF